MDFLACCSTRSTPRWVGRRARLVDHPHLGHRRGDDALGGGRRGLRRGAGGGRPAPPEAAGDEAVPFLYLTVDVPAAPLFKDALELNIIPQVPLVSCLTKFDGTSFREMMNGDRRQYVITKLPKYLVVHIKRFSKNTQQFVEKNPTIVNSPSATSRWGRTRGSPTASAKGTKYHLMCSTQHDGPPEGGTYHTFVHAKSNDQWYEVEPPRQQRPPAAHLGLRVVSFYDAAQSW